MLQQKAEWEKKRKNLHKQLQVPPSIPAADATARGAARQQQESVLALAFEYFPV